MPELPDEYIDWSAYMTDESTDRQKGEIGYFWFLDPDEITIVRVTTELVSRFRQASVVGPVEAVG